MAKKEELSGAKVREMADEEISATIQKLGEHVYKLRCQAVTEKVEDNSQFGTLRRNVARLRTEQSRRRQAGGAKA